METGHRDASGCDGSLSSLIAIGLTVVLQKLLEHDMDTVIIMLTNMVPLFFFLAFSRTQEQC